MEKIKTLYIKTKSDLEDTRNAKTKLETKIALLTKEIAQFEKVVPTLSPKKAQAVPKKKSKKKEKEVPEAKELSEY